jgi:hypothetical protein
MKGYFFFFSTASRPALGTYPASYPMDAGGTFPGSKAAEAWMPTTHFHLVSKLRMHGAIPPLIHTSSWRGSWINTGTSLPLPLLLEFAMNQKQLAVSLIQAGQSHFAHRLSYTSACLYHEDRNNFIVPKGLWGTSVTLYRSHCTYHTAVIILWPLTSVKAEALLLSRKWNQWSKITVKEKGAKWWGSDV